MAGEGDAAILVPFLNVAVPVVAVPDVSASAETRDVLEHLRMGSRISIRLADLTAGPPRKGGHHARGNGFETVP